MTKTQMVREQLQNIGVDFRVWGRSEARELPKLLFPDETIRHAMNGRYEKGFALFCATDQRLLLLDKKPFILCFEDMRYEMISEVDYTEHLLSSTLSLRTPGKTLNFSSYRINRLRELTSYIQEQVTRVRHPLSEEVEYQQKETQYNNLLQNAQQTSYPAYPYQPASPEASFMYPRNPYQRMSMNARRRVPKFSSTASDDSEKA